MRILVVIAIVSLMICPSSFADCIVTLENDKKVILRDDKTWDYTEESDVPQAKQNIKYANEAVEVWDHSIELTEVNYSKSVALHLHYKNNTDKKVVGVVTHVTVINPFGKTVFENTFEDEAVIEPNERMRNDTYWHFDDNPFISGQPYDLMWQMAQNGTAKIVAKVKKVVFADGSVLAAKPAMKKKVK